MPFWFVFLIDKTCYSIKKSLFYSAQSGIIYSADILRVDWVFTVQFCVSILQTSIELLTYSCAFMSILFFTVLIQSFWSSSFVSFLLVLLLIKCSWQYFPFMFWTAGRLSTPFWCFAVPESFSHQPAHNPLCAHQTERASSAQEKGMQSWNPATGSQGLILSPRFEQLRQRLNRTFAMTPLLYSLYLHLLKSPCSQVFFQVFLKSMIQSLLCSEADEWDILWL